MANAIPPILLSDLKNIPYTLQETLRQMRNAITGAAGGSILWSAVDKSGSVITDIVSRNHDSLQNISGGTAGQFFHLTSAQNTIVGTLAAGTYTPTLTNVTNISASTSHLCQYMRVGATVTVSGEVEIDPTAAGALELGVSLPIASNIGTVSDCAGIGAMPAISGETIAVLGDATNDRASFQRIAVDTANRTVFFTFTYRVI